MLCTNGKIAPISYRRSCFVALSDMLEAGPWKEDMKSALHTASPDKPGLGCDFGSGSVSQLDGRGGGRAAGGKWPAGRGAGVAGCTSVGNQC